VLIFLNMCSDVANFFVMLAFFFIAFAILIFGIPSSSFSSSLVPSIQVLEGP